MGSRDLAILEKYFGYYQVLPEQEKKLFTKRVAKFIRLKQFIPRGGFKVVSSEMKVLIAASAVQITFGHPAVYFRHFWRILIYPDDYYSTITKKYHKGEVHPGGLIVLSWKNFIKGYVEHDSGVNLALHEMAHALHLENAINNDEYDFINAGLIKDLHHMFKALRKQEDKNRFFRDYAWINFHEFFAVCIENFFERPAKLLENDKSLYHLLSQILKQDTAKLYAPAKAI